MRRLKSLFTLAFALAAFAARAEECVVVRDAALRQVCLSDTLRPLHDAKADLETGQPTERFAAWREARKALAGDEDALLSHYRTHLRQLAQERLAQRPDWEGGLWQTQAGPMQVELLWLVPDPPRPGMTGRFPAAFLLSLQRPRDGHASLLAGNAAGDREWRWRNCELRFTAQAQALRIEAFGRCDARGSGERIRGPLEMPETLVLRRAPLGLK